MAKGMDWEDWLNKNVVPSEPSAPPDTDISAEFRAATEALGRLKSSEIYFLMAGMLKGAAENLRENGILDYGEVLDAACEITVRVGFFQSQRGR